MVTGFEIFSSVSGALSTLNLVRQLVASIHTFTRGWRDSGQKIVEIHDGFDTFVVRLDIWSRKTWQIDARFTDDVVRACWGSPGWHSIATQFSYIDKTAEDFLTVFQKAVDPALIAKLRPNHESAFANAEKATVGDWHDSTGLNSRRRDTVGRLRELGRRVKMDLSLAQKARVVIDRGEILLDSLTSLHARFLLLERDATAFFEAQHPALVKIASEQRSCSAAQASLLLRNAKASRADSEALFQACWGLTNKDCPDDHSQARNGRPKLEMNVLATNTQYWATGGEESFKMRYHLVLSSPDIEDDLEVLVEGPLPFACDNHEPIAGPLVALDFADACGHIRVGGLSYFRTDHDTGIRDAGGFRLSSPVEPLKPCDTKSIHLSRLLEAIRTKTSVQAAEQFPYAERLNLAFKVAECGLLLIGTSWLSSIDSRNVQRLSDPSWSVKRRFILEFNIAENGHLFNVEPNVFRIGVLLAEIAMGQAVDRIAAYSAPHGIELDLVIAVQRDGELEMRSVPAVEIEHRVVQVMGPAYGKAVAFCLQQSLEARGKSWAQLLGTGSREEENAYQGLSANFYDHVYLPLQKNRDLCFDET